VSQPIVVKRLVFGEGERFASARLWLDGVEVPLIWDGKDGYLYSISFEFQPLAPGPHQAELVVNAEATEPGWYFSPLDERFEFTVAPDALDLPPVGDAETRHALAYLNAYRAAAGLPPFCADMALQAAAVSHAAYTGGNQGADSHIETPGRPGFTGTGPNDRAAYFGYYPALWAGVSEVVDYEAGAEKSIDRWLATPYHRLPLIDPENRLLGYGHAPDLDSGSGDGTHAVDVIDAGPDWPLSVRAVGSGPEVGYSGSGAGRGGGEGGTGAGRGGGGGVGGPANGEAGPETEVVRWPYPGQTGVPTSWPGLEHPDPLRLYPGTRGPLGYTVSLTFTGAERGGPVALSAASLTDAQGVPVECMQFDSLNDENLTGTAALIPFEPLEPNTVYTAHFAGTVGGSRPFDETWSFTTGPGTIEAGPSLAWSWWCEGDRVNVTFDGLALREGVKAYLGGLPARDLVLKSRSELSFRVPAGFGGSPAELLLAGPEGTEFTLELTTSLPAAAQPAATGGQPWTPVDPRTALHPPLSFAGAALRYTDGTVMVPAACLARTGAVAETVPEMKRTHWTLAGHTGTLTLGSTLAYVDGRLIALPLPVQSLRGETYVPAEFVSEFLRAAGTLPDLVGHWAAADVARLVARGIVSGYEDGLFHPDARLTRAAFVKMLVLATGLDPDPGATGGFGDTAGHWVADQGYIGPAEAAGIVRVTDYSDGLFEPDREITREEIALMVVRAMGLEDLALASSGGPSSGGPFLFSDIGGSRYPGYVAVAAGEGILRGYSQPDGSTTFRPGGPATRAEATVIVGRLIDWLATKKALAGTGVGMGVEEVPAPRKVAAASAGRVRG